MSVEPSNIHYVCVGGPLNGLTHAINLDVHNRITYEPLGWTDPPGSARYELRRGDDGVRRLYFVGSHPAE